MPLLSIRRNGTVVSMTDEDWDELESFLRSRHPDLKERNFRLCMLLRLGLSNLPTSFAHRCCGLETIYGLNNPNFILKKYNYEKDFFNSLMCFISNGLLYANSSKSEPMSELMQANVKALAVNEEPDEGGGGGGNRHYVCLHDPGKDPGHCTKMADGSGYSCSDPYFFQTKDCYSQILVP